VFARIIRPPQEDFRLKITRVMLTQVCLLIFSNTEFMAERSDYMQIDYLYSFEESATFPLHTFGKICSSISIRVKGLIVPTGNLPTLSLAQFNVSAELTFSPFT